jgi:hypothetical protein
MLVELVVGVVESEGLGLFVRDPLGRKDVKSWIRPRNFVMMTAGLAESSKNVWSVSNVDFFVNQLQLHHNDAKRGNGLGQTIPWLSQWSAIAFSGNSPCPGTELEEYETTL